MQGGMTSNAIIGPYASGGTTPYHIHAGESAEYLLLPIANRAGGPSIGVGSTDPVTLRNALHMTGFLQDVAPVSYGEEIGAHGDILSPEYKDQLEAGRVFAAKLARSDQGFDSAPTPGVHLKTRKTGEVQFFERLLDIWNLDEHQGATLLGFEQVSQVRDLLSGAASLRNRDAKDRLRHLFEIHAALDSLYRDEEVEREWLREAQSNLNGHSPLDLLLEGSMENLLRIRQFVEYLSGR